MELLRGGSRSSSRCTTTTAACWSRPNTSAARFHHPRRSLGYSTPTLRDAFDVKFFLEPQEPLRLRWKFQRDTGPGGGYTVEQVMALLPAQSRQRALRAPAARLRRYGHRLLSPGRSAGRNRDGLNVRHILRPTLP